MDDSNVLKLDDPELFKYPVAYFTEAGFWEMNDKEAAGLRAYLLKGGFMIFDDFRSDFRGGGGWTNFETNMHRALPEARFIPMDPKMQVYDSFFKIESFDIIPQSYDRGRVELFGLFEDNDPTKRLMVDREPQHRHLGLLGILGHRLPADRRIERGVQTRRELHHLRHDSLAN